MYETVEKVLTCWLQARMGSEAELVQRCKSTEQQTRQGRRKGCNLWIQLDQANAKAGP